MVEWLALRGEHEGWLRGVGTVLSPRAPVGERHYFLISTLDGMGVA